MKLPGPSIGTPGGMLGKPDPLVANVVPAGLLAVVVADVAVPGCRVEVDGADALGISPLREETEFDPSFRLVAEDILLLYVW